jgi:hypothetical protein
MAPANFSDINPGYATAFAPFSVPRLFRSVGTNVFDTVFVLPGTDTPATTNAFGVVFSDVGVSGPTKLDYTAADCPAWAPSLCLRHPATRASPSWA